MHIPEQFHRANAVLCFLIGYATNGTLLWLMSYRTEVDARPYRPILLLATLNDLAYLGVYAVVVPVLAIDKGVSTVVSLGPLRGVPQPYNFAMCAAWNFFFIFSLCSLCVPFLYRYAVICREKAWGVRTFVAILVVPVALALGQTSTWIYAGYPWGEEDQRRARDLFFSDSDNESNKSSSSHTSSFSDTTNYTDAMVRNITSSTSPTHHKQYFVGYIDIDEAHNKVVSAYATTLLAVSYALVFTCAWRIYRHLKRQTAGAKLVGEERALELNRQVSRALLAQSLVPLVMETLPALVVGIGAVAGVQMGNSSVYLAAVLAWTPVVNPLITMWVVRAFRREVANWLAALTAWCWWWKRHNVVGPPATTMGFHNPTVGGNTFSKNTTNSRQQQITKGDKERNVEEVREVVT